MIEDICPICGSDYPSEALDMCEECWEELMRTGTPGNYSK